MKEMTVEVNDVKYVLRKPTPRILSDASIFCGGIFRKIADSNIPPLTRDNLPSYLEKLGVWDSSKTELLKDLAKKINDGERQLKRGGKTVTGEPFTKDQARSLAIDMRNWRIQQIDLLMQLRRYDHLTIDGITENAKFDFLVSECAFFENGKRVFKNYDDYQTKSEEEFANKCAETLSELIYGSSKDIIESQKKNPENSFLVKYGFARENDLELVDQDGHLVNASGKRINDNGFLVDENDNPVDLDGNPITENGEALEEFVEFQ